MLNFSVYNFPVFYNYSTFIFSASTSSCSLRFYSILCSCVSYSMIIQIIYVCDVGLVNFHYSAAFMIRIFESICYRRFQSIMLQIIFKKSDNPYSCRNRTNLSHFSIVSSSFNIQLSDDSSRFQVSCWQSSQFSSIKSFSLFFIWSIYSFIQLLYSVINYSLAYVSFSSLLFKSEIISS